MTWNNGGQKLWDLWALNTSDELEERAAALQESEHSIPLPTAVPIDFLVSMSPRPSSR